MKGKTFGFLHLSSNLDLFVLHGADKTEKDQEYICLFNLNPDTIEPVSIVLPGKPVTGIESLALNGQWSNVTFSTDKDKIKRMQRLIDQRIVTFLFCRKIIDLFFQILNSIRFLDMFLRKYEVVISTPGKKEQKGAKQKRWDDFTDEMFHDVYSL